MKRKQKLQNISEKKRCENLGWRNDLMSAYCSSGSAVTKSGGHNIKGTVFSDHRGKRNRKNYD